MRRRFLETVLSPVPIAVAAATGVASAAYLIATIGLAGVLLVLAGPLGAVCLFLAYASGGRGADTWGRTITAAALAAAGLVLYAGALTALALAVAAAPLVSRAPGRSAAAAALVLGCCAAVGALAWTARRAGARLRLAIEEGRLEYVEAHVRGAAAADRAAGGPPPLHVATRAGQPGIVRLLLEKGASAANRYPIDVRWVTAVQYLFARGGDPARLRPDHDEAIALLVERGAPLTPDDLEHVFAMPTRARSVAALRRRLLAPERIDRTDDELTSFLALAAAHGETEIVLEHLERRSSRASPSQEPAVRPFRAPRGEG